MKILIIPLIILCLFTGCKEDNISPSFGSVGIKLNKLEFSLDEPIEVNIVNKGTFLVYVHHCNYKVKPDIEKKENDIWTIYYSPICLAIYPSGITEFEAGEKIVNTFQINESGTYRIKLSYGFSADNDLDEVIYSEYILVN